MTKSKLVAILSVLIMGSVVLAQESAPVKGASMNPDLSVNALMLYSNSNRGNYIDSPERNGPKIQEAELQLFSDVDPYSKLNVLLSIHQDPPAAPSGGGVTPKQGEWKIEPEELYIDTTEIPYVTIRLGKFKAFMGKHNTLHTHAYPFIDAPLQNTVLLGDEGINDVGVSLSTLVPTPWFSEFTLQLLSGKSESSDAFNSANANTNLYLAHFKNLWDLSDALTAEFGISGATGPNEFADAAGVNRIGDTALYGSDLTFKWRPMIGGKSRAASWTTEYLSRRITRQVSNNRGDGLASWVSYQMAERWWLQVRGDYLQVKDTDISSPLAIAPFQRRYTALIGYFPSEFTGVRLQYSHMSDDRLEPEKKIYLQFNFTIGAHPAHSY